MRGTGQGVGLVIDLKLLLTIHEKMKGRVRYSLGAKAKSLDVDSNDISFIDCSGDVRYLLARASNGELRIPDGSANQLEYAKRNWKQIKPYSNVHYAKEDDSRLFIAFLTPTKEQAEKNAMDGHARGRHVWLLMSQDGEMQTIESRGGRGPDSQPWEKYKDCKWCFEIPVGTE